MAGSSNFISEYKTVQDPSKQEKAKNWDVAIGLQMVDGLRPSKYLYQVARDNIDGKLSHAKVYESLHKYYQSEKGIAESANTKEADLVSNRIAELLGNPSFTFSPTALLSIHKYLFQDVLPNAWVGVVRSEDITKKENVLNGDTVHYASHIDIMPTLEYDFKQEKQFDYGAASTRGQCEHFAEFISGIWQIHPFREGNTRPMAVFAIKYLRNMGFNADNELFKDNAEYFRNALVRANYENIPLNIRRTTKYINLFFGNLLLGENNQLKTSDVYINIANSDVKIREKDREKTREKLKKSEWAFLDAIMPILIENGEITTPEAIAITNKSPQRVWQQFVALIDAGILVAIGEKKGRRYRLATTK